MSRGSVAAVAVAVSVQAGCAGYGMLQTAKVRPDGDNRTVVSGLWASNRVNTSGEGSGETPNATQKVLGPEIDFRLHATRHLDVGIGSYLFGARIDAKYDVAEPEAKWGMAPRLGAGMGGSGDMSDTIGYGGVLGSYEPIRLLGLYGGLTFTNHWIQKSKPGWAQLAAGEREAKSSGWGDGVFQATAGLAMGPREKATCYVEYSVWEPMQDNPGDYFKFTRSQLLAVGLGF